MTKRKMAFAGRAYSSDEWLALRDMLFGRGVRSELPDGFVPPFYCEACDHDFTSIVTPTKCPLCGAAPGEQAVTVTHKGYTAKTFPFFVVT